MIRTGELIREGRSKRMYATDDPTKAVIYFKDEAIAYRGLKRGRILGKGEVNNAVCRTFFSLLTRDGVPNHYIQQLDNRQSLVWRCEIIPVTVKVRNRAAGSLCERLGIAEGTVFDPPVVEFFLKGSNTDDPLVNMTHVLAIRLATRQEMETATALALKVNNIITAYMHDIGVEVIDYNLEFGRLNGQIVVADEISPDVARFWDSKTHEPMDIDRFRRDLGDTEQAYHELLRRMMGLEINRQPEKKQDYTL